MTVKQTPLAPHQGLVLTAETASVNTPQAETVEDVPSKTQTQVGIVIYHDYELADIST